MHPGNPFPDHDLLRAYPGAEVVFDEAFLASPVGNGTPVTLYDACQSAGAAGAKWPVVVMATGSRSFESPRVIAGCLRDAGIEAALIAPATQCVPNRPRYVSPGDAEVYDQVHRLRRSELDYTLSRLASYPCFDLSRLVVMGVSEGGVAAATWRPDCEAPRLVIAWGMERSYFVNDFELPRRRSTPILNLMGWQDAYFGSRDSLSAPDGVHGHGAPALTEYPNARVIIYPYAGHKLLDYPPAVDDVAEFLRRHLCPAARTKLSTLED